MKSGGTYVICIIVYICSFRLFLDPSQTLLTTTFRVVEEDGKPFFEQSRNFSVVNGLLFSSIKRIGLTVNGKEISYQVGI